MLPYLLFLLSLTTPKESLRFQYVNEQQFDTSCGYSTAASLLSLYWEIDVTERDIVNNHIKEKIDNQDYTTSLADLSEILNEYAIANKAYKMEYSQLAGLDKKYFPIIVHYDKPEGHFALVIGIEEDSVITADPARGLETLSCEQFLSRWSNIMLLSASAEKEMNKNLANAAISTAVTRKNNLERWAW